MKAAHRAKRWRGLLTGIMLAASAASASAEVIVFTSGRTMSVKDYRIAGDSVTVTLRQGGEATFSLALVSNIAPDEVPDAPAAAMDSPGIGPLAARRPLEARPFAELIAAVSLRHGVDPALVHAVIEAESNYRPRATSRVGARGLMQVMPATGRDLGVRNARLLFDPRQNLEAGVKYLKLLLDRFEHDLPTAIAAYNAGPAAVLKYAGIPPYPETRNYVRKVLANLRR